MGSHQYYFLSRNSAFNVNESMTISYFLTARIFIDINSGALIVRQNLEYRVETSFQRIFQYVRHNPFALGHLGEIQSFETCFSLQLAIYNGEHACNSVRVEIPV